MSNKRFDLKKGGYVPRRDRTKPVKLDAAGYPFDTQVVARAVQTVNKELDAANNHIGVVICAVPLDAPEKVFVIGNMPQDMVKALFQNLAVADTAVNKEATAKLTLQ